MQGPMQGKGNAPGRLALALRCRSLWGQNALPADPDGFFPALAAEVERLKEAGADLVEFHADACAMEARYADPALWARVRRLLDAAGLGATVHLPFVWVDLAALDDEVWEGGVRAVERALAALAPLEPRLAALHPVNYATGMFLRSLPQAGRDAALAAAAERVVAAVRRLTRAFGTQAIALENLEGMPVDLFRALVEQAEAGVCLDVGHAISNGDDPLAVLAAVAHRLTGLHLHDAVPPAPGPAEPGAAGTPGLGRAHLPLGQGVLDLPALLEGLRQHGFTGPVVLEVDGDWERDVVPSALRLRALLPAGLTPP